MNQPIEISISELEKELDYTYKDKSLIVSALTHSSCANEQGEEKDYERLEFLGDSVLSLVVAEYLFHLNRHRQEGEMTKLRAALVCEKSLFVFAKQINLGKYIRLGKGEENNGGRQRPSILSDVFEAVIASLYLDIGYEKAKAFILRFIPDHFELQQNKALHDYKTALQEIVQQNKEEKIEYVLISETGPDHDKEFFVEVHLNSNVIGKGLGKSKKQAEQLAAKEALELMGYEA